MYDGHLASPDTQREYDMLLSLTNGVGGPVMPGIHKVGGLVANPKPPYFVWIEYYRNSWID